MAYEMHFEQIIARWPDLLQGAVSTLNLSAQSIAIGVSIGLCCAVAKTEEPRVVGKAVTTYVEAFRNTPLLVQLFLIYFGLPLIGMRLSADTASVFAISLNLGAYSTEIIRAGLTAIPKTQIEAGAALGLSRLQVVRYIVIIPALRVIYPALTGQLTLTLLGTSIASAISATELTSAGSKIESTNFRSLETFLTIAAIYITMTFLFRFIYWLIGLWLFHRKVPQPTMTADIPATTGAA